MSATVLDKDYAVYTPDGTLVATKHRREFADGSKSFWWFRTLDDGVQAVGLDGQGATMPLYRSEKIDSDWVVIAEGGKATDALAAAALPALGTDNAAVTPSVEALQFLHDKQVFLWPDNDDAGHKHMRKVAERLHSIGVADVRMVNTSDLPEKADAADVEPAQYNSYLDGAEEYSTPAHEQSNKPHVYNSGDLKKMFLNQSALKWEAQQAGVRLNLMWGFERLDKITDGIPPGLISIHAAPAAGKTAWVSQIAQQVNAPVLYLTAEMSVRSLLKRMVSRITNTPHAELLSATLSPEEESALVDKALAAMPLVRFVDASSSRVGLTYLRETMAELQAQDDGKHALLIIDSLHTWLNEFIADSPDISEYQAINNAVNELRKISTDLNIPILIVCERNRASSTEFKKKDGTIVPPTPSLNAVAGSRVVEYRSDIVFSLDKAEEQGDAYGRVKDVVLTVLKNRDGVGDARVPFEFMGSTMKWSER
jgi:replicative DNA helicase